MKEPTILAVRSAMAKIIRPEATRIPCANCGAECIITPATVSMLSCFSATVLCLECGCAKRIPDADEVYQGYYGKPFMPGPDPLPAGVNLSAEEPAFAMQGPECAHLERKWMPVLEIKENGRRRFWVNTYKYCDGCAAKYTTADFKPTTAVKPDEFRIVWMKEADLAARFGSTRPKLDEQLGSYSRRLHE